MILENTRQASKEGKQQSYPVVIPMNTMANMAKYSKRIPNPKVVYTCGWPFNRRAIVPCSGNLTSFMDLENNLLPPVC